MRTRVLAWTDPDGPPDLDVIYENGVSAKEMARIMQEFPCTNFALMEPVGASLIDIGLAMEAGFDEEEEIS